jgi:hypothetical protein
VSCSGGARNDACFSARLMWRTGGMGELYTYLPPSAAANDAVCTVPPYSECNPTYGASVARGAFNFTAGGWTTVAQRVRLNDVGSQNGELQLWAAGASVLNVTGLVLRDKDAGRMRGVMVQTFFGGQCEALAGRERVVLTACAQARRTRGRRRRRSARTLPTSPSRSRRRSERPPSRPLQAPRSQCRA